MPCHDRLPRVHSQRQTTAGEHHLIRPADRIATDGRWSAGRLLHSLLHVQVGRSIGVAIGIGLDCLLAKAIEHGRDR
jgi:hypothetical protein